MQVWFDHNFVSFFIVILDINVMVAESIVVAQVEDPVASTSAEDIAVHTSAGEPSAVEFVAAPLLWRLPQQ